MAEAELAWPELRIAFLSAEQADAGSCFSQVGWRVAELEQVRQEIETYQAWLEPRSEA